MIPCSFEQSNFHYDKPPDMSYEECLALSVFHGPDTDGKPVTISCWKCTKEELDEINRTGRIWCFHYGIGLQPHALSGTNPFEDQ